MRLFSLMALVVLSSYLKAQIPEPEQKEVKYFGVEVALVTTHVETGEVITSKPLGFNAFITYNSYFKYYELNYEGPKDTVISRTFMFDKTEDGYDTFKLQGTNTRFLVHKEKPGDNGLGVIRFVFINQDYARLHKKVMSLTISGFKQLTPK